MSSTKRLFTAHLIALLLLAIAAGALEHHSPLVAGICLAAVFAGMIVMGCKVVRWVRG